MASAKDPPRGDQQNLPESFWHEESPETLLRQLEDETYRISASAATAVRDRAATFLLADPSCSQRLALALLDASRRPGVRKDDVVQSTAWRTQAEALLFTGQLKASRTAYARACAASEAAHCIPLLGQILVGRIHLLSLIGETKEADRLVNQAERLLKKSNDLVYLGKLYMNRGNTFYQKDRYAEAHDFYGKAMRVFDRLGLRDATWAALIMNRGITATNLFQTQEARALFLQTEQLCDDLGLDSLCARAQHNRAFLEALAGDYRHALSLLEAASTTFEQQDMREMQAAVLRSRAEIYLELGLPSEARNLLAQATTIFDAEDMAFDAALGRMQQARALIEMKEPDQALSLLTDCAVFFRQRKLRPRHAMTLLLQARAEATRGGALEAAAFARRAIRSYERLDHPRGRCQALRVLAEVQLGRRRLMDASKTLNEARPLLRRLPLGERVAYWQLAGEVSLAQENLRAARSQFRRAAQLLESERLLIPGVELRSRAFESRVQVYLHLMRLALQSAAPRVSGLFEIAETARARGFREHLARGGSRLRRRVAERRLRLGSLMRRLDEIEADLGTGAASSEAKKVRKELLAQEQEILELLRGRDGTDTDRPSWGGAPSLGAAERKLRPDERLIEYFVAEPDVVALTVGPRGSTAIRLPAGADTIRRAVEAVEFQMSATALASQRSTTNVDFLRRSADATLRDLYDVLVAPLAENLPIYGKLIWAPHRFLHRVPFECLHTGGSYLIEQHHMTRIPTADFLVRRLRHQRYREERLQKALIAGLLDGGPAFVKRELEIVSSLFPAARRTLLRDMSSKDLLANLREHDLVHLATHGMFREDSPLFSRLKTVDGALFLLDILDLELNARLVVLSACESGQVSTGQADELAGVAHGFLAAGVRWLIAGQWRIHDEATEKFIHSFYRNLAAQKEMDPMPALREARKDTRSQYDHPFYWGGLTLFGV